MQRYYIYGAMAMCLVFLTTEAAFAQNYKIKQTVTMNGQSMTNTTYVRGPRKRTETSGMMGMGGDVANIEQCDLKQNVRVNDKKRLYVAEPFSTGDSAQPTTRPAPPKTNAPVTRGGTVTYISNITDTGERKPMFGVTARHLKTSTTIESSPDACNKSNMSIQTDGWYIDLPEFSCPTNIGGSMSQYQGADGGCQDRVISKSTGSGKLGFPLSETRTMSMTGTTFSQTTETIEFSKAILAPTLFDIPAGYSLAGDTQALYGTPDYSAMANAQNNGASTTTRNETTPAPGPASFSGTKIGVLVPSNRGDLIETSALQSFLVDRLTGGSVMGVAVSSEAQARSMNLDYVLSTEITKLKQSTAGKIGGLFGKVTGAPTAGTYDTQVEYKLLKLADGKVALSNKSSAKTETEINAAARNVLGLEAAAVLAGLK